MNLTTGTLLQEGKYKIETVLGKGCCGITYRAQTSTGETVVVKTLNESLLHHPGFSWFQQQFFSGSQHLAWCQHPNVVKVLDCFAENEQAFMVMEYIDGQTLAEVINTGETISEAQAIHYIRQIASGLSVVHQRGLLHRDINPHNIIRPYGTNRVILTDFGLTREFSARIKPTHHNFLSSGYAAIEQYLVNYPSTTSTDIYALAATFFYLLTGTAPIQAPLRIRHTGTKETHIPPGDLRQFQPFLSQEVEHTICRGLEIEPNRRPQTIDAFLSLLSPETVTEIKVTTQKETKTRVTKKVNNSQKSPKVIPVKEVQPTPKNEPPVLVQETSDNFAYVYASGSLPKFPLVVLFGLTTVVFGWIGFDLAQQYTDRPMLMSHVDAPPSPPSLEEWLDQKRDHNSSHPLFEKPSVPTESSNEVNTQEHLKETEESSGNESSAIVKSSQGEGTDSNKNTSPQVSESNLHKNPVLNESLPPATETTPQPVVSPPPVVSPQPVDEAISPTIPVVSVSPNPDVRGNYSQGVQGSPVEVPTLPALPSPESIPSTSGETPSTTESQVNRDDSQKPLSSAPSSNYPVPPNSSY